MSKTTATSQSTTHSLLRSIAEEVWDNHWITEHEIHPANGDQHLKNDAKLKEKDSKIISCQPLSPRIIIEFENDGNISDNEKINQSTNLETEGGGKDGVVWKWEVKEVKSAQQLVYMIHATIYSRNSSTKNLCCTNNSESLQNDVSVTTAQTESDKSSNHDTGKITSTSARFVVRVWKGSSHWWNLNVSMSNSNSKNSTQSSNAKKDGVLAMAIAEVAGYRMARQAFRRNQQEKAGQDTKHGAESVVVPQVLYFSCDYLDTTSCRTMHGPNKSFEKTKTHDPDLPPFAVFENVGPSSPYFSHSSSNKKQQKNKVFNASFTTDMVKIRHEFGYDEPHPRHGRVAIPLALQYAMRMLEDVILPVHGYCYDWHYHRHVTMDGQHHEDDGGGNNADGERENEWSKHVAALLSARQVSKRYDGICTPFTYDDMVAFHQRTFDALWTVFSSRYNQDERDTPMDKDQSPSISFVDSLRRMLQTLKNCIDKIDQEEKSRVPFSSSLASDHNICETNGSADTKMPTPFLDSLPAVLVHCDVQPQNMILYKLETVTHSSTKDTRAHDEEEKEDPVPFVSSVLDYEECAYADPRFELLLLGRKVCANVDQARAVWSRYDQALLSRCHTMLNNNKDIFPEKVLPKSILGPMEPWMKLEAVHSILEVLLRMMHMSGGGRGKISEAAVKTQQDMISKVERELSRLALVWKWQFCSGFAAEDNEVNFGNS